MVQAAKLPRRARWAVPAAALVVTSGVMAGSLISVAQAAPALPPRTPAQLLAAAAQGPGPELSGTVPESVSLGLPMRADTGSPASAASLRAGSDTADAGGAGTRHHRRDRPATPS